MIPLRDNIKFDHPPVVTLLLIVANVFVYLLSIGHGGSLWSGPTTDVAVQWGAIPYEITHAGTACTVQVIADVQQIVCQSGTSHPPWEAALTSMFMHGSLLHLAGNMVFLWIFGDSVEAAMGSVRFFAFYIVGGIAALALQVALSPDSVAPMIGASGAIAAVLGAYMVLYPRARILTLLFFVFFFTIVEMPALVMLIAWFLLNALVPALGEVGHVSSGGGVAYFAHIGGFLFGILTVRLLANRTPLPE